MDKRITLADRLKSSPLTRTEIAKRTGVSRPTLWLWEKGHQPIEKVDQVIALARVLGCAPADLRPDLAAIFGADP